MAGKAGGEVGNSTRVGGMDRRSDDSAIFSDPVILDMAFGTNQAGGGCSRPGPGIFVTEDTVTGDSIGVCVMEGGGIGSVTIGALYLGAGNTVADGVDDRLDRAGVAGGAGRMQADPLGGSGDGMASRT